MYKFMRIAAALAIASVGTVFASTSVTSAQKSQSPPRSENPQELRNEVGAAVVEFRSGDIKGAETTFRALTQKIEVAPDQLRFVVYFLLAVCEQHDGNAEVAYADMVRAGEAEPIARDRAYWQNLALIAAIINKDDVAAEALLNTITSDPAQASDIDVHLIQQVLLDTRKSDDGGVRRQALLQALWQVRYMPKDVMDIDSMQNFWFQLFEIHADNGENKEAREVLASLDQPWLIIGLQADNRYRSFSDGDSRFNDSTAVNEHYIASCRALATAHPRQIGGVLLVANALMSTDHLPEALALLDEALAKTKVAPTDKPAFDDLNINLRWVLDARARVLARLGRWDDVLASQAMARDSALEHGDDVVSQKINLADIYYRLNRPRDAINEIKDLAASSATTYGLMSVEEVHACAYAQLGDKPKLKKALVLMLLHSDEATEPLYSALECANDKDSLAAAIIARLGNPQTRNDELIHVQNYLPEPHSTDFDAIMAQRLHDVLVRPDVRSAITRYGESKSYSVFAREY